MHQLVIGTGIHQGKNYIIPADVKRSAVPQVQGRGL
jgi:hypothetical protein